MPTIDNRIRFPVGAKSWNCLGASRVRDPIGQLVAASYKIFDGRFCVWKSGPQRIIKKTQSGDATDLVK